MSYLCTETMLFLMHNKLGVTGGDDEPHANILALVDADRSVPTHQFHVPDELYAQFLRYCLRDKVAHERARDEDPRVSTSSPRRCGLPIFAACNCASRQFRR
jgi:hypothetical protein